MSKYHPLDVRHPANRPYLSKNYLLDPPSMTHDTRYDAVGPARDTATRRPDVARPPARRRAAAPASGAQPVAPWGSTPTPAAAQGASGASRAAGILRTVFFLGVFGFIVLNQTDAFEILTEQLRSWALDLGIPFPF